MRAALLITLASLINSAGCQHVQLKNHTLRQARTLTDIQYRQVLDNIALFSAEPDSMPFFLLTGTGQTNINTSVNVAGGLNWDLFSNMGLATLFYFDKANLGTSGTNGGIEQWTTAPCLSPGELEMMRCVYQRTIGCSNPGCEEKLSSFYRKHPEYLDAMRPGWYCVGTLRQVPKNACYVGHHKDTYVWVTAEGLDALTRVSIGILDIATTAEGAIPDRLDPRNAEIKALEAEAAVLADILNKHPDKKGTVYDNTKVDLEAVLTSLHKKRLELGDQHQPHNYVPRKNVYNQLLSPLTAPIR